MTQLHKWYIYKIQQFCFEVPLVYLKSLLFHPYINSWYEKIFVHQKWSYMVSLYLHGIWSKKDIRQIIHVQYMGKLKTEPQKSTQVRNVNSKIQ